MGTVRISVCMAATSDDGGTAGPSSMRGHLLETEALWLLLRRQVGAAAEKNVKEGEFVCGSGG